MNMWNEDSSKFVKACIIAHAGTPLGPIIEQLEEYRKAFFASGPAVGQAVRVKNNLEGWENDSTMRPGNTGVIEEVDFHCGEWITTLRMDQGSRNRVFSGIKLKFLRFIGER